MIYEDIAGRAREIQKVIFEASVDVPIDVLWQHILGIFDESECSELSGLDLQRWSSVLSEQVRAIFANEPFPDDLAFIYFDLYDSLEKASSFESARVGFYLSGGTDTRCEEAVENGDLSYFPVRRRLYIDVLDRIRDRGRETPEHRGAFNRLILLAGASVLAKGALSGLGPQVPAFVGFDSGDYFQVR